MALPGYGDCLEELTPGTRKQPAKFGAAGFEAVVGAIQPLDGEAARTGASRSQRPTPTPRPRKAAELGGQVVAPPVDAPSDLHGEQVQPGEQVLIRVRRRLQAAP
ncbi:MAG: hypothetical protein LC790_03510 [Actinobacteria bacterium]|nr:hypothetical protein [Actinomycetota bacterium]MCA1698003.1 hypothetical protein [Actinomycetota bacterium]